MKPAIPQIDKLSHSLTLWYKANQRPLPWRMDRDPYRVWISEVMLQQTTVAAVIPYYERFLKNFPTIKALAKSPLENVLESWAGLGYYSRARNLHKSAIQLAASGFPKTAAELLELPGFGPYTSRAVSSIAFGESVGVLDGNVIRVLSRVFGLALPWWNSKERQTLQDLADKLAQANDSYFVNQGLMELGATICTPQSPTCLLCPWNQSCVARDKNLIANLPTKKPRKEFEVWVWQPEIYLSGDLIGLQKNDYTPFLKGQMLFPGQIKKSSRKPKTYDLKHGITHHDIYIQLKAPIKSKSRKKDFTWIKRQDLKKINPSNLLQKVLAKIDTF